MGRTDWRGLLPESNHTHGAMPLPPFTFRLQRSTTHHSDAVAQTRYGRIRGRAIYLAPSWHYSKSLADQTRLLGTIGTLSHFPITRTYQALSIMLGSCYRFLPIIEVTGPAPIEYRPSNHASPWRRSLDSIQLQRPSIRLARVRWRKAPRFEERIRPASKTARSASTGATGALTATFGIKKTLDSR